MVEEPATALARGVEHCAYETRLRTRVDEIELRCEVSEEHGDEPRSPCGFLQRLDHPIVEIPHDELAHGRSPRGE